MKRRGLIPKEGRVTMSPPLDRFLVNERTATVGYEAKIEKEMLDFGEHIWEIAFVELGHGFGPRKRDRWCKTVPLLCCGCEGMRHSIFLTRDSFSGG